MRIVTFAGSGDSGSPDCPEWHTWRSQGLGGSDAGVIAAAENIIADPPKWFKSANQLWELKTGKKEDDFKGNWATRRGQAGEAIIRELYEKKTGLYVSPIFGEMDSWPVLRSSFDGVTLDAGVITEIKCPGEAVYSMAMRDMALRLLDAEQRFWERVKANEPVSGNGWLSLAAAWKEADAALAKAKEDKEMAETLMQAYLKQHKMEVGEGGGVRYRKEARAGSVDYKQILTDHNIVLDTATLDSYRGKGSSSWVARNIKQ